VDLAQFKNIEKQFFPETVPTSQNNKIQEKLIEEKVVNPKEENEQNEEENFEKNNSFLKM